MSFFVYTLTAPNFRRELLLVILFKKWIHKFQLIDNQRRVTRTHQLDQVGTSIDLRRMTKTISEKNHHHYRINAISPIG